MLAQGLGATRHTPFNTITREKAPRDCGLASVNQIVSHHISRMASTAQAAQQNKEVKAPQQDGLLKSGSGLPAVAHRCTRW